MDRRALYWVLPIVAEWRNNHRETECLILPIFRSLPAVDQPGLYSRLDTRSHSLRRDELAGSRMHELAITESVVEAVAERVGEHTLDAAGSCRRRPSATDDDFSKIRIDMPNPRVV
jgi:hypothetical protein